MLMGLDVVDTFPDPQTALKAGALTDKSGRDSTSRINFISFVSHVLASDDSTSDGYAFFDEAKILYESSAETDSDIAVSNSKRYSKSCYIYRQ